MTTQKITAVVNALKGMVAEGTEVSVQTTLKCNEKRHSIVIREAGKKIAPAIHIDEMDDTKSAKELATVVYGLYLKAGNPDESIVDKLNNWEEIKSNIFTRVMPIKGNEELLENLVYEQFCDLAVVPYIVLGINDGERACANVTTGLRFSWVQTVEEIMKQARKNSHSTYRFSHIFDAMQELHELSGATDEESEAIIDEMRKAPMFVLTNKAKNLGASAIADKDLMMQVLESLDTSSITVIPSSIHEIIVIPARADINAVNDMIKAVNANDLMPAEVLSDHAYILNGNGTWEYEF